MTTDTVPKQAGVQIELAGRTVTIAGATKGVGMIAPNMATTLGFLTTDAAVESPLLQDILRRAADATYNCLTVDGHTSTNDTLCILASGLGSEDAAPMAAGSGEAAALEAAVTAVCDSLGRQIVSDGEGATKRIEIRVTGAATDDEARAAARAIANSPLVKCAFFGEDPNWGRIVSAAGYAGISSGPETMRLEMGGLVIFDRGAPVQADQTQLKAVMAARRIDVHLDLGAGTGRARFLTCDLTYDYVKINAEYTT
jgi:glutamate N-acetyltransferase/amino-acid N-acetyltransferase